MHPLGNSHTHPLEPETTLDLGGVSAGGRQALETEAGDAQADVLLMPVLPAACRVWKRMRNEVD